MIIIKYSDLPVGSMVQFIQGGDFFLIEEKSEQFIRIRSTFNPEVVIVHTRNLDRLILNFQFFRK